MQFAGVQACVQGRAMHALSHPGATVARAQAQIGVLRVVPGESSVGRFTPTLSSHFLAPGLEALRLHVKTREHDGGRTLGVAVRAGEAPQVGAYEKDAFVSENEAQKIAHVRGSCGVISCVREGLDDPFWDLCGRFSPGNAAGCSFFSCFSEDCQWRIDICPLLFFTREFGCFCKMLRCGLSFVSSG